MKRIHDSLQRVFQTHRLVFWYDPTGEWAEPFDAFADASVNKLKVMGNEFGTKVRIVRDPDPQAKFLIYFPSAKPQDHENWLLDLVLQGIEYKADRASLALQDAGLPSEFLHLAQEHAAFFRSDKRVQALRELLSKDDQAREIRLKMMAVLASTAAEIDALLLHFLSVPMDGLPFDPIVECLASSRLEEAFWGEVQRAFAYAANTPSLRDFALSLFRGANPLDKQVPLHPHARVLLQRWKDSQSYCAAYRNWARRVEAELQIAAALSEAGERAALGDSDTFEVFEKFVIHRLCQSFMKGESPSVLRAAIQQRRSSIWQTEHAEGYSALEQAVELRELLASAELTVDSVENGVSRYLASWWRIDMAYRRCTLSLRRYGQVQLMEQISQWVEGAYVNNFLLPLSDRWSDQIRTLATWECQSPPPQHNFFHKYVEPFRTKGQKVFVVISDALRYEAAAHFAQRLSSANRWTAEVEALFGCLPSYTQLGMASLLPGNQLAVDAHSGSVTIDGRSAAGILNRAEILRTACAGKATGIQAEDFLELNSKTDGRALMRDHEVIYIFHNTIDKIGDVAATEGKTFEAVESAFGELDLIIKKVANINGSNILLTADHGFIFQQDDLHDGDMTALPNAVKLSYSDRRFAIGNGIAPNPSIKVFNSDALGVGGDWSVAFPLSLCRFPLKGSGKRYVHGGFSLQEIVIPVVKIHKARADDTGRVDVELLRVPSKITTGQISISLFQTIPAVDKVLPRTLRVGIFAKDGTCLSEIKAQTFDSKNAEARHRETSMLLVLSHAADSFNNQEVDLRLEETLEGTNQIVIYKTHGIKLQKPFASDFDEL